MMVLAQITNPDTLTGSFMLKFLLAGLLLLQIANIVAGWMRGRDAKRRSISFEGVPLDKAEFERHVAVNKSEHDQIFHRMGGAERGIRAEVKADTTRIEEKINTVDRKVSALDASTDLQNQKLAHMDAKLDRLIERRTT